MRTLYYVKPVFHCKPLCFWTKAARCNLTDDFLVLYFCVANYTGVHFCGKNVCGSFYLRALIFADGWKKSQKLEPPIYIADTNGTNLMWTVWITQFKNRPLYGQRTFSWRTMITVLARSVFKKSCTFNSHPSPPLRKGQGRERETERQRDRERPSMFSYFNVN